MDAQELLLRALNAAVSEPELVADIAESCQCSNIDVFTIANSQVEEVADKLFLTPDEAANLLAAAKKVINGEAIEQLRGEQQTVSAIVVTAEEAHVETGMMEVVEEEPMQEVDAVEDDLPPVPAPEPSAEPTIPAKAHEVTVVVKAGTDKMAAAKGKAAKPAPAPAAKSTPPRTPKARPTSAPAAKPTTPSSWSSSRPATPSSSNNTPSYLRPTSAHLSRSAKATPEQAPKPSPKPFPAKPSSNLFSRLLAPTAAFLSHVTRRKAESKEGRQAAEVQRSMRQSQMLSMVLAGPQGQRVTKSMPFALRTEVRPTSPRPLSTEEAELLEAQKHAFKRHEVPAHLRESRPIEGFGRTVSTPAAPEAVFKPFNLLSQDKHAKYQELRAQRLAEEKHRAEEARVFKASQLDKQAVLETVQSPRKPPPAAVTRSIDFKFASEERVKYHADVLTPARRARMSLAEREKLEAHERELAAEAEREAAAKAKDAEERQKAAELEAMDVASLRKSMVFKARAMPDFSAPFSPDASKAAPVTQSQEFALKTDARLGKAPSVREREDLAASSLNKGRFDGHGFSDAFTSSLRASGSFSPRASANGLSSLRRSMASPLSPSGSGSAALRRSTHSLSLAAAAAVVGSPRALGRSPLAPSAGSNGSRAAATTAAIAEALATALEGSSSGSCGTANRRATCDAEDIVAAAAMDSPRVGAAF